MGKKPEFGRNASIAGLLVAAGLLVCWWIDWIAQVVIS